jgi:hypothetical protein
MERRKNLKRKELRKKCEDCEMISKAYRMFDIDGKNLILRD